MDLGGRWRAAEADDALRRVFADPDMDDVSWTDVDVPHHWRSHPAFAASDGPLLYRRRFEADRHLGLDRRCWLQLDGLFYQGDVWLDRSYLGDTEGYFFPHCFEVTEAMRERSEHLLALELTCSRPSDLTAKRNLTGVFQHWSCFDRDWNPGGIWRPVHLYETGPVRIVRLRVLCIEATQERATVEIRAQFETKQACTVTASTVIRPAASKDAAGDAGAERRSEHALAAGSNDVRWRVPVEQPALWWPHALGDQPLYDLSVELAADGVVSDRRQVRTGLRQVRMKDFIASVNGERLFLKGTNQGPTRRELGQATAEELERDVLLARHAGLDLVRLHGHISRPELYDAADRHGLLLWQDLPLQWGYKGVRQQAVRQAGEAVELLGHHPSVAIWCGHNEPIAVEQPAPTGRSLTGQLLPTWNKSILDRAIHRALEKADSSRPVVSHSGVLPHPALGTDSHLYFGWYRGGERDLPRALARLPILARFVSEFGAQAVPESAEFCQPERWPDLDWEHLARAHALQKDQFDAHVPPADYPTFEAWRAATQAYQAQLIRFHVETLRRLKYRPAGGFCQFCFADGQPAITWSVLDHERQPKAGLAALTAACAPVIVVADRPEPEYRPGDQINLDIHLVSDLRVPIAGGRVRAVLSWPGASETWHFEGGVDADSCALVGTVRVPVPDVHGPLFLDLDVSWPAGRTQNRYESRVRAK